MPRLVTAAGLLALLASGCGGAPVPELRPREGVYELTAGRRYLVSYAAPVDDAPIGATWSGSDLQGSPLAAMARPALVLKADDFGPAFEPVATRFIEAVDVARGLVSLGIITSKLTDDPTQLQAYRTLHAAGFELWFHGHRHEWHGGKAEFKAHAPVQQAALDRGLSIGRNSLGLEFHSFGAPGNGSDHNTGGLLRRRPQLVVWLFGEEGHGLFVIPRKVDGESKPDDGPFVPRAADATLNGLEALRLGSEHPDVVAIQVHPREWSNASLDRFLELVRLVADGHAWRFSGPYDEWCWLEGRGALALTKSGGATYELDLGAVPHDLRLDLDPAVGPLPASVQPVD